MYFYLSYTPTEGNGEKYKHNPVLGWRPNSIGNYALVMFPHVKTLFHIYKVFSLKTHHVD